MTSFSPQRENWWVVRYVSRDCGSACGGCLRCILDFGAIPPGPLWCTIHVFRFSEEARRFLALSVKNSGNIGLLIDLSQVGILTTGALRTLRVAADNGQPGGGFELVDVDTEPIRVPSVPASVIPEYFEPSSAGLFGGTLRFYQLRVRDGV